ncbi:MAG TPA: hypothetical protein DEE98_07915 [Elusimicrobia bacterium]|nr:MAG: hypothetical protein A2278_00750 [Elusimicrobia bacterium RIFOXYA12_FULL_49_49]OGS15185.1 MAG: hypothetical protein A2251_00760 [Elusimicrobia bacterium RIFOXYA2_FULL_47_53]OGS26945.1 MAG: hypothetical protein A2339_01430 [Elusimicrobia bacterium RIFOXYB12_FULL_50_12]OGS29805.1 MAG: hypothetical protein A2323_01560 [Elusimicrobia bacterium RIFOXYB2_FULL_46_23]HBU70288.1 hypothetical protein [Elusimicrobiota bacterium]
MQNKWRFINSGPMDGADNMALDEAEFLYKASKDTEVSSFRVYWWSEPCVTIGYFQKHNDFLDYKLPIFRRMTGGLAVRHWPDISYSLVTGEDEWPAIYDQNQTYKLIHSGIKKAMNALGIKSEFSPARNDKSLLCVKTIFEYDLISSGKKLVGSSQRRRGKTLLVQGSIHIPEGTGKQAAAAALLEGWQDELQTRFSVGAPESFELQTMKELAATKYNSPEWNLKY